jgi:hypothetical protein
VTDLAAALDHLLSEPRPSCERRSGSHRDSPLGRALTVFNLARDLVIKVNHAEAMAGWEERQARLRSWQDNLSAGLIVGAAREALWADVESLRVRGAAQWEQTAAVHKGLGAAYRRVSAIVDSCKERQSAIRAATETKQRQIPTEDIAAQRHLLAAARDDLVANQRAACEQIAAETRCVLDVHERTAAISVAELWGNLVEQN